MILSHEELFIACIFSIVVIASSLWLLAKYLWGDHATPFFLGLFNKKNQIGAITPSSRFLVKETTKSLYLCQGDVKILEQGSGTGQMSSEIVSILDDLLKRGQITSYELTLIELNPDFCEILRKKFECNSRVKILCIDASSYYPNEKWDAVICSLPLVRLPKEVNEKLLKNYLGTIKEQGTLSYIEYLGGAKAYTIASTLLKENGKEIEEKISLLKTFKSLFLNKTKIIWINIPPSHAHHLVMHKNSSL